MLPRKSSMHSGISLEGNLVVCEVYGDFVAVVDGGSGGRLLGGDLFEDGGGRESGLELVSGRKAVRHSIRITRRLLTPLNLTALPADPHI
jgi:hypothetical protein